MRGNPITNRNGKFNPNYKHGLKNTRLYRIYYNMKNRCYNEKSQHYKSYGGRGIRICDEWLNNFIIFYDWSINNGYSDNLSIDRIDNNGNYTPNNCKWTTTKVQSLNRRDNAIFEIKGIKKPLMSWCEEYNINYKTVRDRLKRGWDITTALNKPVDTKFRRKL